MEAMWVQRVQWWVPPSIWRSLCQHGWFRQLWVILSDFGRLVLAFFFSRWVHCSTSSSGAPPPQVGTLQKHQDTERGSGTQWMLLYLPGRQSSIRIRQEKGGVQSIWNQEVRRRRGKAGPHSELGGVWLISRPLTKRAPYFTPLRRHVWGRGQIKVTLIHNRKPLFSSTRALIKIKRALLCLVGGPEGPRRRLKATEILRKAAKKGQLQFEHFGSKSYKIHLGDGFICFYPMMIVKKPTVLHLWWNFLENLIKSCHQCCLVLFLNHSVPSVHLITSPPPGSSWRRSPVSNSPVQLNL